MWVKKKWKKKSQESQWCKSRASQQKAYKGWLFSHKIDKTTQGAPSQEEGSRLRTINCDRSCEQAPEKVADACPVESFNEEAANPKPFTTLVPTLNEKGLFFEFRSLFLF